MKWVSKWRMRQRGQTKRLKGVKFHSGNNEQSLFTSHRSIISVIYQGEVPLESRKSFSVSVAIIETRIEKRPEGSKGARGRNF